MKEGDHESPKAQEEFEVTLDLMNDVTFFSSLDETPYFLAVS